MTTHQEEYSVLHPVGLSLALRRFRSGDVEVLRLILGQWKEIQGNVSAYVWNGNISVIFETVWLEILVSRKIDDILDAVREANVDPGKHFLRKLLEHYLHLREWPVPWHKATLLCLIHFNASLAPDSNSRFTISTHLRFKRASFPLEVAPEFEKLITILEEKTQAVKAG